jgi:hypothetical protein
MKLQQSKFNVLLEYSLNRYQLGGFLVGDVVTIKPTALKHKEIIDRGQTFKDILESKIKNKDLLRVAAVKSIRPDITGRPNNSGVADFYVDVFEEYAPGLFHNVMTLPAEVLEVHDHGINLPPPAGHRRKSKVHKSKEADTSNKLGTYPADSSTPKVNTTLPNANKWPNEPGGRKAQKY